MFWPQPQADSRDPSLALAGVIMRIELPPYGVVERVWEVPDYAAVGSGAGPGPGGEGLEGEEVEADGADDDE